MSQQVAAQEQQKKERKEDYKVFVYGTLKKGFNNHKYLLKDATFLGREYIDGMFTMISLGHFPGLVAVGQKETVYGEVYSITEEELEACDALEGHPTFYKRTTLESSYGDAYVYLLPDSYLDDGCNVVDQGVWHPTKEESKYVAETEKKKQSTSESKEETTDAAE